MRSIWAACPSANPERCAAVFAKWKSRGYMTAVLLDGDVRHVQHADLTVCVNDYPGYAASINLLCERLSFADWMVAVADDLYPDGDHDPQVIAAECERHFAGTFGVMQPLGDPYGALESRASLVSPWMGKDWRRRINGGRGPLWPEYYHFYDDAEHMEVASRLGRLWWREDLSQYHDHRTRNGEAVPDYIAKKENVWIHSRDIFARRKAAGFPGHEPLPA